MLKTRRNYHSYPQIRTWHSSKPRRALVTAGAMIEIGTSTRALLTSSLMCTPASNASKIIRENSVHSTDMTHLSSTAVEKAQDECEAAGSWRHVSNVSLRAIIDRIGECKRLIQLPNAKAAVLRKGEGVAAARRQ